MWTERTLDKLHFTPLDQIHLMHGLSPLKITKSYLLLKKNIINPYHSVLRVVCGVCAPSLATAVWPALLLIRTSIV